MYFIIIIGFDVVNMLFFGSFYYVMLLIIDVWGLEVIYIGGGILVFVMLVDAILDGLVCMFLFWY